MRITVVGLGYVGLSNAVLLARHNTVTALDIDEHRVDLVNQRSSPIADEDVGHHLRSGALDLVATTDAAHAYDKADFVIVATPTDYDPFTNSFDTSTVESVIDAVAEVAGDATVVIKSTVPVGFTEQMVRDHPGTKILFSPEFLREGRALHDNLHPSRIVVGTPATCMDPTNREAARTFAGLLQQGAVDTDVPVLLTAATEAEAIKLFANTYLALRVAYFNELDTYAATHCLDPRQIIEGVGLDPRIGPHYNNPSFGYGGYCLPKDTMQLQANYRDIPQNLISAIVDANLTRKEFIAAAILRRAPKVVGIYRLTMKSGSDNFRESAVLGVINALRDHDVEVIIHEPGLDADTFDGAPVVGDLDDFKARADLIVANRMHPDLHDVIDHVFTRDIYSRD